MKRIASIVFGLASIWILSSGNNIASAQIGSGFGGIGSGFGGGGLGSSGPASGMSGTRSGLGTLNSPIANPSPSLTPSQVFNPPGTINSGQVLNPRGSINRPRTGIGNPKTTEWPISRGRLSLPSGDSSTSLRSVGSNSDSGKHGLGEVTSCAKRLRADAMLLANHLSSAEQGDVSAECLQLTRLQEILADQRGFESVSHVKQLRSLLARFEAAAENDVDATTGNLPALKATTRSLRELIGAIHQHYRQELIQRLQQFDTTLNRYRNGEHWSNYFRLTESVEPRFAKWNALGKRFDNIANSSEFRKVASIPEFRLAHTALQDYLRTQ